MQDYKINWIKDAIFYHIYPLGFCNAPKINNEDKTINRIKKVIEWIPHLKKLGVNTIYFGPVFESSEHGYDTKDYLKIDKRLGTNKDFKEVCDKLHEEGFKIILDGVFNHVGREFWAFKDVQKNGASSKYCGWFQNLNFNANSPMGDSFWYEGWNGHYNLVKLNIGNEDVKNHIFNAIGNWIDEFDIDGLRLDAADYMDRDFFKPLKKYCISKKKNFWLMGEVIHGDYNMWANEQMLDSVTNYECYKGIYSSHNDKNYFEIAYSLNRQFGNGGLYKHLDLYNFVDNHDVNRIASTVTKKEYLFNIYTLLMTMPKVPSIYYGSEWGIEGKHKNNSDDELRPCLELDNINKYDGLEEHIAKLCNLRKSMKALRYGNFSQVVIKNEQFLYKRSYENEDIYIALNLSERENSIQFYLKNGEKLIDRLNGNKEIKPKDNTITLTISAFSGCVLEKI
ncbi:MAG: alpha-amylase family glycosyl hydrolase [Clostridiaceae bacterium]|nr:alpha-amylase family glycosyl hydrolase [Clostridiaceae bacterium]